MKRVLWIDSGAKDLAAFTAPIYLSRQYDLHVALSIAEALQIMSSNHFDAVVTEAFLDRGDLKHQSEEWNEFYANLFRRGTRRTLVENRLGLCLLYALFAPAAAGVPEGLPVVHKPEWCRTDRFAIFSTEPVKCLEPLVAQLHLAAVREKDIQDDETQLMKLIEQILRNA